MISVLCPIDRPVRGSTTGDDKVFLEMALRDEEVAEFIQRSVGVDAAGELAHTLGGIVPWEQWSEEAQLQLDHLKLRGAF
jgi:hypothetical protein